MDMTDIDHMGVDILVDMIHVNNVSELLIKSYETSFNELY